MNIKLIGVVLIAGIHATGAHAQSSSQGQRLSDSANELSAERSGPYVGLSVANLSYSTNNQSASVRFDTRAVGLVGGMKFSPNVSLEGRVLSGRAGEEVVPAVTAKLDKSIEVKAIFTGKLSGKLSAYGSVGFARNTIMVSAPGLTVKESESSPTFGVGLQYQLGDVALRAGYEVLHLSEEDEIDGLSFSANYQF